MNDQPAGPGDLGPRPSGPAALLRDVWRGWERFWFTPLAPTTLGLMRLCCGLLAFYVHLGYSWGLFSYIGPNGWIDKPTADYVRLEQPSPLPSWGWDNKLDSEKGNFYWSVFFHVTDPTWLVALHVACLLVMLLFALGLWSNWTCALSWVAAVSYAWRSYWTVFGLDTMLVITLTYLVIAPCGATLSLDRLIQRWRARRAGLPEPPPAAPSVAANFSTRLIQVHFCLIYLAAGTSKLLGPTWWSATAPNFVVLNYAFAPFDVPVYQPILRVLAQSRLVWETIMTGGVAFTIAVELGFPFLVWDRRWRWACVCASVLLHLSIGIFMGLVAFSLIMLVMLLAFIPPEVVGRGLGRLRERWRKALSRRRDRPQAETKPKGLVLTRS
jgi:hypothetical protein